MTDNYQPIQFHIEPIVLLPFPFTDLSSHKKRPVLILIAANAQADFLAVQITSQPGHANAIALHNEDFILGVKASPNPQLFAE